MNAGKKLAGIVVAICIVAVVSTTAQGAIIFTENFDALTAGSDLSGQGGWTGTSGADVVVDPGFNGFNGNIVQYTTGGQFASYDFGGPNPSNNFNDTDPVTFSMDVSINGDSTYTYLQSNAGNGSQNFTFGIEYGNLTLRRPQGTLTFDHNYTGIKTYHMEMDVDPTGYGGNGAATVSIAEWIGETTLGPASIIFSNEEILLQGGNRPLTTSTGFKLRTAASGIPQVDNILITQAPDVIPEPSTFLIWTLGLLGLGLVGGRRRKRE